MIGVLLGLQLLSATLAGLGAVYAIRCWKRLQHIEVREAPRQEAEADSGDARIQEGLANLLTYELGGSGGEK